MSNIENTRSANTDPSELEKFNVLADKWWDPTSEFKPLHDINPLRLNYIEEFISLTGKTVLDIGCGGGLVSEGMAVRGANVSAIDMAPMPLEIAKKHAGESGYEIDYQQSTAESYASQHAGKFDVVTCLEMLEHVPEPEHVIQACADLVKPGGYVFFSTINRNPKSFLFAIVGAEYVLKLLPKGTHEYKKLIKPSEMQTWAEMAKLGLEDLRGMTFNPLTQKYKLNQDVSVNYLMAYRKPF